MGGNIPSVPESDEISRASKGDTPAEEARDKHKPEGNGSKDASNIAQEINPLNIADEEIDQSGPSTSGVLGGAHSSSPRGQHLQVLTEMTLRPGQDHHLDGPAVNAVRSRKRTRAGRYSSDITYQELARHFHLPSTEACREIGLGLTAFKNVCRKFGVAMWPYKRPRKSPSMAWPQELHADEREESRDIEEVQRESSSKDRGISDARLNSGAVIYPVGTVQNRLPAKPDRSQVGQLQALESEKKECEAVKPALSGLNLYFLKQLLKYRDQRSARHTPGLLTCEQSGHPCMGNSDIPSARGNAPVPGIEMIENNGLSSRIDYKSQEWTTTRRRNQDVDVMMMPATNIASSSGIRMHGIAHSEHVNDNLAKMPEVEYDRINREKMVDQDVPPKSLDLNYLTKFNQMMYLWNVLLLLDSIQADGADAS
eukprot:jgi/Picsp_1/5945/NSC_03302-R1_protein